MFAALDRQESLSSNVVAPQTTVEAVLPAIVYPSYWFVLVAVAFAVFGFGTRGRTIEELDASLDGQARSGRVAVDAPAA